MNNSVNIKEIEETLIKIKNITDKVRSNLLNMDNLINDNINSGIGVWDGESARIFKSKWEEECLNIEEYVEIFETQQTNLEKFIKNTKEIA